MLLKKTLFAPLLLISAITLFATPAAFADTATDDSTATTISPITYTENDEALWQAVDEKAEQDGAVDEPDAVSPQAKASKRPAKYPIAKGFILVTKDNYKGVVPSGHAGIIYSENKTIEAMPNGVVTLSNTWYKRYKTCYGAYVLNTSQKAKNTAANWAYKQIGKPYNYDFYNMKTRKAFYCSQLVWAAYKDTCKIDLDNKALCGNAIHPGEILLSNKVKVFYKQQ